MIKQEGRVQHGSVPSWPRASCALHPVEPGGEPGRRQRGEPPQQGEQAGLCAPPAADEAPTATLVHCCWGPWGPGTDRARLQPRSPLPCFPGPSPPALSPAGPPMLGTDRASPAPCTHPRWRLWAACAPGCRGLSLPPAGHRQLRCHYPTSRSPIRSPRGDRLAPPLRRQRPHSSHGHGRAAGPLRCGQRGFPLPATSPRTLPKVTAPAAEGGTGAKLMAR